MSKQQTLILLNGPKGVGKDTVGRMIVSAFSIVNARTMKFAGTMKDALPVLLGLGKNWKALEATKDTTKYYGYTFREWQINCSEDFLKRFGGDEIFARIFAKQLELVNEPILVATDCGFEREYEFISQHFGPRNTFLVRLTNGSSDFSGDSRSYIPGYHILLDTSRSEMATEWVMAHVIHTITGIAPREQYHRIPKGIQNDYTAIFARIGEGAVKHPRFID